MPTSNFNKCTLQTCSLNRSYVGYAPNLAANSILVGIFGLILLLQIGLGIRYKTWAFMAGLFSGMLLEVIGYSGRLQMHSKPFDRGSFLL